MTAPPLAHKLPSWEALAQWKAQRYCSLIASFLSLSGEGPEIVTGSRPSNEISRSEGSLNSCLMRPWSSGCTPLLDLGSNWTRSTLA
jgi:hypothetical protein